MKYIFSLLFWAFGISAFSQSRDSSIVTYNDQRGNFWIKKSGVPAWQIDGYRAIIRLGDTLVRARASGVFTSEELNIRPNGSNMASAINAAVSLPFVKAIKFVSDSSRAFTINSNVNFKGKTASFENGAYLTGTAAIDSILTNANDYAKIFDTTLTITHWKTSTGYITVEHLGGRGDSVVNNSRYFQIAINIASANKTQVKLLDGNYFVNGVVSLKSNTGIYGGKYTKISAAAGTQFTFNSAVVKNLTIKDFSVKIVDAGTNANLFNLNTERGPAYSEYITLENVKIDANSRGGTAVSIINVRHSLVRNVEVRDASNVSIRMDAAVNNKIENNKIFNSGRSGIALSDSCTGNYIMNNYVNGWMQRQDLTDGAYDSYGPANDFNYFLNNVAVLDSNVYNEAKDYILFRNQGGYGNSFISNKGFSNSRFLRYAVRDANRDADAAENNVWIDNEFYLSGNVSRIISIQGAKNFRWQGGRIKVDSLTTTSGTPTFFAFTTGVQDTIQQVNISGVIVDGGGTNARFIDWQLPIRNLNIYDVTALNMNHNFYVTSETAVIESMSVNNLTWRTNSTVTPFPLNNIISSFLLTASTFNKGGANTAYTTTSFSGVANIKSNMINGAIAPDFPSTSYRAIYAEDANTTLAPDVFFIFKNRTTSTSNVILPAVTASDYMRRIVGIKTVGTTPTIVKNVKAGQDSVIAQGNVMYFMANPGDTSWHNVTPAGGGGGGDVNMTDTLTKIATKADLSAYAPAIITISANWGLQGGGNLTANREFNVDSSLVATRARLNHVRDSILALIAGYDTLTADFVRDGDSLRLTLGDKAWAVKAAESGGGSGTVNSGAANRLSYYASSGTALSNLAAITANRALISDATGLPTHSSVTNTELGYLSGVTSAIQTQLNGKVPTSRTITINGTTYDLSANRSWTISSSPSYVDGYLIHGTGTGGDTATALFYDKVNKRLGVNNPSPDFILDADGDIGIKSGYLYFPGTARTTNKITGSGSSLTLWGGNEVVLRSNAFEYLRIVGGNIMVSRPITVHTSLASIFTVNATGYFKGRLKADTIPNGTASDSLLVTNGGEVRKIPPSTYMAIDTGSYYPAFDATGSGIQTYTVYKAYWEQKGNRVRVWGTMYLTAAPGTTAGVYAAKISLPIASYFENAYTLSGSGSRSNSGSDGPLSVRFFSSVDGETADFEYKIQSAMESFYVNYSFDYLITEGAN